MDAVPQLLAYLIERRQLEVRLAEIELGVKGCIGQLRGKIVTLGANQASDWHRSDDTIVRSGSLDQRVGFPEIFTVFDGRRYNEISWERVLSLEVVES